MRGIKRLGLIMRVMQATDKKYKEHHIFKDLKRYIKFYESLSMSVFSFCTVGTRAICNIDSYVYSSIKGTLESINVILRMGRMNDAYALLRKYYDSAIINVYSNLYLENNRSIENFIVKQINNWIQGKEKLPEYRIISQYIKVDDKLNAINKLLDKDNRYKKIRDRCNDHIHYNFFHNILLNDNAICMNDRLKILDVFCEDVRNLFILHMAYVFYFLDHYMSSSDYLDYLEVGMTPNEGSQYWVAPFVQDIFDEVIKKERSDIADAIKQHSCMSLS